MAKNFREENYGKSYTSVIDGLEKRITILEQQLSWDRSLREKNPVLQDLYEKYIATLLLVKK